MGGGAVFRVAGEGGLVGCADCCSGDGVVFADVWRGFSGEEASFVGLSPGEIVVGCVWADSASCCFSCVI